MNEWPLPQWVSRIMQWRLGLIFFNKSELREPEKRDRYQEWTLLYRGPLKPEEVKPRAKKEKKKSCFKSE